MKKEVEGQGVGQHFTDWIPAIKNGTAELAQLFHCPCPGTAGGLIGADHHPAQRANSRQRCERQSQQDRRAIGIGDDALMGVSGFRVDFRNHKRNLRIHPKGTGVVNHDSSLLHRHWGPLT